MEALARCGSRTRLTLSNKEIQGSSMVERSAVNRLVVGSNPTRLRREPLFMFWVYVLQNPAGNFYIGHTNNLENRVTNHKEPMVPDRLISGYSSTMVNRAKCATACAAKAYPESRSQTRWSHLSATAFEWNAYSLRIQPEPSRPVGTAAEVAGRVVRFVVRSTTD